MKGPKPLSEPETQIIPAFLRLLPFPPTLALSLHSYGRSVLHPFSCKSLASTLNSTILHFFKHGVRSILSNISHPYTTGQPWEIPGLYSVNGDAADYLFHVHSILAFTVEFPPDFPPKNEYLSFWPPRKDHKGETNLVLWNALKLAGCDVIVEETEKQKLRQSEKHDNENRNKHEIKPFFRLTVVDCSFLNHRISAFTLAPISLFDGDSNPINGAFFPLWLLSSFLPLFNPILNLFLSLRISFHVL